MCIPTGLDSKRVSLDTVNPDTVGSATSSDSLTRQTSTDDDENAQNYDVNQNDTPNIRSTNLGSGSDWR